MQTNKDFEVVIVDNGSTDGDYLNLKEKYSELNLSVKRLEQNSGFASANNIGARLACGEWLALLNADAFPEPDWLERMLDAAHKYPNSFFSSRQIQADTPDLLDGEGLLLSTCNRVEVYAVVEELESGYGRVQEFLADAHLSLSSDQLTPHLYWHAGDRAIGHLFRVASSLDSMIVGESQILGQIKDAFEVALTHKASGLLLNKIVKKAISVAKRVRTETKIARRLG